MNSASTCAIVSSLLLFFVGSCAQPPAPPQKEDNTTDIVTILHKDGLTKMDPASEKVIEIEVTNRKTSQPVTVTAKFDRDNVMYGEFIGSPPRPSADKPELMTAKIKIVTPKHKGKYKFSASCRYEGEKVYDVHSKTLDVEVK